MKTNQWQGLERDLAAKVMGWEFTIFPDSTPVKNGAPVFYVGFDGVHVRDPLNGYSTHWQPSEDIEQAIGLLDKWLQVTPMATCSISSEHLMFISPKYVHYQKRTGSLPLNIVQGLTVIVE